MYKRALAGYEKVPSGQQTGWGVYLTPGVGQWPGKDWYDPISHILWYLCSIQGNELTMIL
jgi:hypothetical protein